MDWAAVVQAVLFALFAALNVLINTVIGPFYNNVFVPEMDPQALYPSYMAASHSSNIFSAGAAMSDYVVVNLVDPVAVLVIVVVGVLYLLRASLPGKSQVWTGLAPRLVLGVLLSNIVLPLSWLLWSLAALVYGPLFSYGGGAWQDYGNLVPIGGISFSWDNGVITFIVSLVLLSLVLALAFLIAFRDALIAVLLVLLPPLTLMWPIPPLSGFARRAWRLFGEMAFLPSLVVIPLELAVGSPSVLMVGGLLAVAVGMPMLITQVGASLSSSGFPHVGSITTSGVSGGYDKATRASSSTMRSGMAGFSEGLHPPGSTGGKAALLTERSGSRLSSVAGAAGGPAGTAAAVMWGAGKGIGRLGTHLMQSKDRVQANRTSPPSPLPTKLRRSAT